MNEKSELLTNLDIPLPMCLVDENGKIKSASSRIGEVFLYDGIEGADVFALTGVKHLKLMLAAEEEELIRISRNNKYFKITPRFIDLKKKELILYFTDISEAEELRKELKEKQSSYVIVNIDNYDELIISTAEENQSTLISAIEKEIRFWGTKLHASVTRYKAQKFFLIVPNCKMEDEIENHFDILDRIKKIETEADFPVTLSIGVGMDGDTPDACDKFANEAMDLALGRGGDQAVVKRQQKLYYYGGKSQTVEKSNKGKSRIIGHALKRLIETSHNVIIMGHKNPDMDAFGAALGLYRLASPINKETYIIVNEYNEALELLYSAVKETGEYNIINNKKAETLVESRSVVIVVDTHRPSITEFPELLEQVNRLVVIDHHRKGEESISNALLTYMEPYASSTCELVAEILQYTLEKKALTRLEAEALMAGISVDTNRFSVKTGVRTFEAAAWLKRAGADMTAVKRFFQINPNTFITRAKCVAAAEYNENGFAFSICEGLNANAQIINSQVADELLTINGIKASFVAGMNSAGKTVISARSIGDLNVQVIMERFNGGGHLNTAGAQVEVSPKEAIEEIKKELENNK